MNAVKKYPYVIEIITFIGVIIYIGKSLYFAHSALSIGDEGAYLFKGLAFARGEYHPFQEYGFWTNKSPLAFLIPGYAQYWFGAGLREARYFALAVSFLFLTGLWIVTNRLGGKGWGAIAVWVLALSDAHIGTYSQALSQGLVACMMVWMLVCVLGENRPLWQLILGSMVSILIVMTRQNMVIVPPIVILYIFWQYGSKSGWWAFGAGVSLLVVFLVPYWPQILQLWAGWIPQSWTPFLDDFRISGTSTGTFGGPSTFAQWQAFATGVRDHFFVLFGVIGSIVLWPSKNKWKNPRRFKDAVFLGILFLSLFVLHMWGSLLNDFCVLCFTSYQMFFSAAGLVFVLLIFSNGVSHSKYRTPLLVICLLFYSATLGLYYYQIWGGWLLDAIRLPRFSKLISDGRLVFVSLRDVLTYALQVAPDIQARAVSAAGGAVVGILLMVFSGIVLRQYLANRKGLLYSTNVMMSVIFLFTGTLAPSILEYGEYQSACSTNFLSYYEQAGRKLAEIIPPDSLVYWKGSGRHLALLLYEDDFRYFPPQITAGGGYLLGDSNDLLRFGLYNPELDRQWRESSDIFIIWRHFPTIRFEDFLDQTKYEAIPFDMGKLLDCEDPLYIFKKRQ